MTNNPFRRALAPFIAQDLKEKMVFLSGPRQVGKTTLALQILGGTEAHPAYFNWDDDQDRRRLLAREFPQGQGLLVLDEVHKYRRWRNWLKGLYDKTRSRLRYLVTGSARLDLYSRGGDSLTGRYHFHHLHPLSLPELDPRGSRSTFEALLRFGGFPEPFFHQSEVRLRRWQLERMRQVVREDLRDLRHVSEVALVGRLAEHLPNLVGAPLSINSLREDLQVAHQTAASWLDILESLYVFFRIPPYGARRIRAVKKERKAYLWDWSQVPGPGPRFENMIACQLLKYCHSVEGTEGCPMELRYLRDTDGREVDFIILRQGKPILAVECQTADSPVPKSIPYFIQRLGVPKFYLVHQGAKDYQHAELPLRVLPAWKFAIECGLP